MWVSGWVSGQGLEFRASLSQCPDVGLKVSGSEFRVSALGLGFRANRSESGGGAEGLSFGV